MARTRIIPEDQRIAVAAEVRSLLAEREGTEELYVRQKAAFELMVKLKREYEEAAARLEAARTQFVEARKAFDKTAAETVSPRRVWSQASLGAACGLSQEAIRRAQEPNGVTPAVVAGILKVTGKSMRKFMAGAGIRLFAEAIVNEVDRELQKDEASPAPGLKKKNRPRKL